MKISTSSWIRPLGQIIHQIQTARPRKNNPLRLAVMGVGNELNADDGAGVLVARQLRAVWAERENVLVVEAGPAPENFTGLLRRFQPDLVIMIDAAQMDEPPGSVRWIEWDTVDGVSASTHRLPPTRVASFLMSELGCQVVLLGIQVGDVTFDRPVTMEVRAAVDRVVAELLQNLKSDF